MCLCMLFAFTGLIGCSDSNDEPEPDMHYHGTLLRGTLTPLQYDQGFSPDSTEIGIQFYGNHLLVYFNKVQLYDHYQIGYGGNLTVFYSPVLHLDLYVGNNMTGGDADDIIPGTSWYNMECQLPGLPQWFATHIKEVEISVRYNPFAGLSQDSVLFYSMETSRQLKDDFVRWNVPVLSVKNAVDNALRE